MLSWSFRVALTGVCVTPLTSTPTATPPPTSGQASSSAMTPMHADTDGTEVVTDISTSYRFWNQFLDIPLVLPSPDGTAQRSQQPRWRSLLHFCCDGVEKEVPLEVCRPTAMSPQHRGTHDPSAERPDTFKAVSQQNIFFSYSIDAKSTTALAESLASRYAAVHVLLQRAPGSHSNRPDDSAAGDKDRRTPSPVKRPHSAAALDVELDKDDDSRKDIVLASATVSLLDLAISENDRFYFNVFTNVSEAATGLSGTSSARDAPLSCPDCCQSRRRMQLCGRISLLLRMDEEQEVNVRPRLVCLRGELPAASYQLRYGWCANDALSLGTRHKRRQASSSRETSPSRPSEHVSTELLQPGVAHPRVTFKQDQLLPLQLTCSRAALTRQDMFLEVLVSPTGDATGDVSGSVGASAAKYVTARGRVGLERFIIAAQHDSKVEAVFTAHCEVHGDDASPADLLAAPVSCEVEGVLDITNIPAVCYALRSAAATLHQAKVGPNKEDNAVGEAVTSRHRAFSKGPAWSMLNLVAAATVTTTASSPEMTREGSVSEVGVPHTARSMEVPALASPLEKDCGTASSSGLGELQLLMTPQQSLRHFSEPLAFSQAPFSALSLAASPFPFSALTPPSLGPAAAKEMEDVDLHNGTAPAPAQPLHQQQQQQQQGERPPIIVVPSSIAKRVDNPHHEPHSQSSNNGSDSGSSSRRAEGPRASPLHSSIARVPLGDAPPAGAHRQQRPHPLYVEELSPARGALQISGISVPSIASPTFGTDGLIAGEPSVSLLPRSTPRAPSALALKATNSLAPLFPAPTAQFIPLIKESSDAVIHQLVSGGTERTERDALGTSGMGAPSASPFGSAEEHWRSARGDHRSSNSPANPSAVDETTLYSTTASLAKNTHAVVHGSSPLQHPQCLPTEQRQQAPDSHIPHPQDREAEGAPKSTEKDVIVIGNTSQATCGSAPPGSSCQPTASLSLRPPTPHRVTSTSITTNTDTSLTQHRGSTSIRSTLSTPPCKPARTDHTRLPHEDTRGATSATETDKGSTKNEAVITQAVSRLVAARRVPSLPDSLITEKGAEGRQSSRKSRSLDPEFVLRFSRLDSNEENDDDEHNIDSKDRSHDITEARTAQHPISIPVTPNSTVLALGAPQRHSSSKQRRLATPRCVTSEQLSPAPPSTLAPPPPEAPPTHLLPPSDGLPHTPSAETEHAYATALQLSAQYRTLLQLYTQKLASVSAAESRADAAAQRVEAAQTRLHSDFVSDTGRETGTTVTPCAAAASAPETHPASARLDLAHQDAEVARRAAKEARKHSRELQQRLANQQRTHRTALAQLRSQDDALAHTEEELQRLLSEMILEREELVVPMPPVPSLSAPTSTNCRGSSPRVRGKAITTAATNCIVHQPAVHSTPGHHCEALSKKIALPSPPVEPPPSSGTDRLLNAHALELRVQNGDRQAPLQQSPVMAPQPQTPSESRFSTVTTSFSPNPRNPTLHEGEKPKMTHTPECIAPSNAVDAAQQAPAASVNARSLRPSSVSSSAVEVNEILVNTTPKIPAVAPSSSYHRLLRFSLSTPSPSHSPALPPDDGAARNALVRCSGSFSPRGCDGCPEQLSTSLLSHLEQEALLDGIDKGDRPLVLHLLHTKPRLFFANNNLLHTACGATLPDAAIVEMLLRMRPELTQGVDAKTGNSVLHVACGARCPSEDTVKQLIVKGVPAQLRNYMGLSAFHVAVLNHADSARHRIKDTLLTLGDCDVNERTTDGRTALHLVCQSDRYLPVVQYLLQRGADVDFHAPITLSSSGDELSLTPLQLSHVCHAEQVARCIREAGSQSAPRFASAVE
jgi:hypothetical protein